jgi:hypothetical protein
MTAKQKAEEPEVTTEEVEVQEAEAPEQEAYESESARYQRIRAAAKEEAAVTMAADAKAAQRAKDKRLGKAPTLGNEEFLKAAAAVEKSINAKPTKTEEV